MFKIGDKVLIFRNPKDFESYPKIGTIVTIHEIYQSFGYTPPKLYGYTSTNGNKFVSYYLDDCIYPNLTKLEKLIYGIDDNT